MKILLNISYVGTAYCGYQVQKNAVTIQQRLNEAASALFGFECDIVGCSRTDRGVHANMFCATVTKKGTGAIETAIDISRIPNAMNAHLPFDVAVTKAQWVPEDFHPRYDVKYKEYVYRIYNAPVRNPMESGRSWHIPFVYDDSAIEKMNRAAAFYVGIHDFSAFMASGSAVESTVRCIKYANVVKKGDIIEFTVAADGFLYNMVRILTGTLVSVAQGKLLPESIPEIIESKDRTRAGMTAPAEGLYLNKVVYD